MKRTALVTAAALALSFGAALPAAAGSIPSLNLPHLTWPDAATGGSSNSKDCLPGAAVDATCPAPGQ